MVNLCVTTFKRQDLLVGCLRTVFEGTVKPDWLFLIDQAGDPSLVRAALANVPVPFTIIDLEDKRGCESSAVNWYLQNVAEERIIAHEDIVFSPDTLERFLKIEGAFVIDATMGLMTYRDECVEAIGLYDIEMSPNYFRYVDVDYEDRLAAVGIHPAVVECGLVHLRDGTMKSYSTETLGEYFHRQDIARQNYERKWGHEVTPGDNTIGRAAWRQRSQV